MVWKTRVFRGVRGAGFGFVTFASFGCPVLRGPPNFRSLALFFDTRLRLIVKLASSKSAMEVRVEGAEESALEATLLKNMGAILSAVCQSMPLEYLVLSVVAGLECCAIALSVTEFPALDMLEFPGLGFSGFTFEEFVLALWKNCLKRPDELLDVLPVKKEKGLLNLYGT